MIPLEWWVWIKKGRKSIKTSFAFPTRIYPFDIQLSLPIVRGIRGLYVESSGEDKEAVVIVPGGSGENASVDRFMQVKHQP